MLQCVPSLTVDSGAGSPVGRPVLMFIPDVNEVMKVRLDLINSSTPINTPPSPEARAS